MVQHELFECAVLIIAAFALDEVLRRDHVAAVKTELERVLALGPTQVLDELIRILDAVLRRAAVRADIEAKIVEREVWECIRPGKLSSARLCKNWLKRLKAMRNSLVRVGLKVWYCARETR